jgi:hypothetical protein
LWREFVSKIKAAGAMLGDCPLPVVVIESHFTPAAENDPAQP